MRVLLLVAALGAVAFAAPPGAADDDCGGWHSVSVGPLEGRVVDVVCVKPDYMGCPLYVRVGIAPFCVHDLP